MCRDFIYLQKNIIFSIGGCPNEQICIKITLTSPKVAPPSSRSVRGRSRAFAGVRGRSRAWSNCRVWALISFAGVRGGHQKYTFSHFWALFWSTSEIFTICTKIVTFILNVLQIIKIWIGFFRIHAKIT